MPIDPTLDPLKSRLARLLGARPSSPDRAARHRLAEHLEARVAANGAARARGRSSARSWRGLALATRLAVASVIAVGVTVGACQMPAEVDVDMGLRVVVQLPVTDEVETQMRALGAALDELATDSRPPAAKRHDARVEIQARTRAADGDEDAMLSVTVDLWAAGLREADVVATVEDALPTAEIQDIQRIEGSVRTTLGDRFAHELFDTELDTDDVEAAKARILSDLEARGIEAKDASVEIRERDGHREIEVRVEQRHDETTGHGIEARP